MANHVTFIVIILFAKKYKINFYFRTYGENIVYTDWKKDNYIHAIKEVIGDLKENIGVEMDHMNMLTHKYLSSNILALLSSNSLGN